MTTGPSPSWSTPARADRWFSAAELAASPSGVAPLARFGARSAVAAALLVAATVLVDRSPWPILGAMGALAVAAVVILVAGALVIGSPAGAARFAGPGRPTSIDEAIAVEAADLADRLGVAPVAVRVRPGSAVHASVVASVRRRSSDGGPRATIDVSEGLLARPSPVRRWVVAHELAHVARRDGRRRVVAVLVGAAVAVGVVLAVEAVGGGVASVGAAACAAVVAVQLVVAWRCRVQERRADLVAARLVAVDAEQLRPVVAGAVTPLDPGRIARSVSGQLAPAERLETARRLGSAPRLGADARSGAASVGTGPAPGRGFAPGSPAV